MLALRPSARPACVQILQQPFLAPYLGAYVKRCRERGVAIPHIELVWGVGEVPRGPAAAAPVVGLGSPHPAAAHGLQYPCPLERVVRWYRAHTARLGRGTCSPAEWREMCGGVSLAACDEELAGAALPAD